MVATLAGGEKKHDNMKVWLDYEPGVTSEVGSTFFTHLLFAIIGLMTL